MQGLNDSHWKPSKESRLAASLIVMLHILSAYAGSDAGASEVQRDVELGYA